MERKVKVTKKSEHVSKEGLDNGKHNDSWLHPEIWDEEWEKESNRRIYAAIRKGQDTYNKSIDLIIDLSKGRIDTSKLVRRAVQVRGKNGKIFTRMQWVDPKTGLPASQSHHTESSSPDDGKMSRKQFIDQKVKMMPDHEKYALLDKHGVQYKHNDHPSILHKNKVVALKEHLYKNPHLVGAEHLKEDESSTANGIDAVTNYLNSFKNDNESLYAMMKKHGIADIDPRSNPEDKAAAIKHMHNMMKLKKHLQENPNLMGDHKPSQDQGTKEETIKPEPRSVAEKGNNSIHDILRGMSSDELYTLMRKHGIADVDPRLDDTDKAAPIKHMHNMMKLKKVIENDPSILGEGILPEPTPSGDPKPKNDGYDDESSKMIGQMSKDLKQKLIDKYSSHPDMKDRRRHDDPNIDYMNGVMALKKLLSSHPDILQKHKKEIDQEQLMAYKIGNKAMARVLRSALGLKGVGDVKSVENGVEWSFATGFVRKEQDDEGEPILSVVETGKNGDEWNEHVIPMHKARSILEGSPEEETSDIPLSEKTMDEISQKLNQDFDSNYTPAVGDRIKSMMPSLWTSTDHDFRLGGYSSKLGLSVETTHKLFNALGVKTTTIGNTPMVARSSLIPFKRLVYSNLISSTKGDKKAHDFIYKSNGFTDVFPLHESARQWQDWEKNDARKELVHSSIDIPEGDRLEDHGTRHEQLTNHIHDVLGHVPFDLMTDMMANGYRFRFPKTSLLGVPMEGGHYLDGKKVVEMDHRYYSSSSLLENSDPSLHKPENNWNIADTTAHEFAHAIDNFLSGGHGFCKWDQSANGSKYVDPKYQSAIKDSYHKAVSTSNPKYSIGKVDMANGSSYLYHKDNWISSYEGRIYDKKYYGDESKDHIEFDPYKQMRYDKSYDQRDPDSKVGVEHWSENVSRYINAKREYQTFMKEVGYGPGEGPTMDEWAKDHHKRASKYYKTDEGVDSSTNKFRVRSLANQNTGQYYGFNYHEMKQRYPLMVSAIKSILDRGDFKGGDDE